MLNQKMSAKNVIASPQVVGVGLSATRSLIGLRSRDELAHTFH